MAALAAPISSSWIPEDDLLLKNAIEAGASLEALAKGAVRFSRKFTVRELQDRWRSLLYDPVISAEASARMFEAEQSGNHPSSKSQKNVTSLDNAQTPSKRNFDSIRRMYYSMRKRICTALHNPSRISFIGSVNANDCVDSGGGYQEGMELHDENLTGSYALGGYVQNHFGFQENIQHHGPHDDILEGNPMNDCFNEFPEKDQPSSMKEAVMIESLERDNAHESSLHVVAETVVDFGKCSSVDEMAPSHAFPDSGAAFHSMGYSSPQPEACLWNPMEDGPPPVMPINDFSRENKGLDSGERIINIGDTDDKRITSSEYNVVDSEHMLKSRHSSLQMNGSATASRGDFGDLSDSLLNFSEENGNIFLDSCGRDTLDKSCYDTVNSLLVSSPNDVHENDIPNVKERKTLVSDTCHGMPNDECLAEFERFLVNQSHSARKKERGIACSEANMPPLKSVAAISCTEANVPPSTSLPGPHSPGLDHKVICCTLNSEDPEIPCNDHVFFEKASDLPASQISCLEASDQASTFANKKTSKGELSLKSEDNVTQSFTASKMVRLDTLPETVRHVKVEFHDAEYHATIGQANNALTEPDQLRSSHAFPSTAADDGIKEDISSARNAKDTQMLAETIETALGPEGNPSISDLEHYESNDDVPCFSDIEAMILDMDLCPDDSDSCISREVARYQPEDAKRTILRLEQCARASLQRTVASQGAFAVFYGRHLKHYVRETEVMLGRATEDVDVDINLGREGRANKISRRQALIKMEEDGSFYLKNLGKNSMFVNGKEVSTGHRIGLSSSSLIEIREMAFVFEINHKSVRRYLANKNEKNLGKNSKFGWADEQVTRTIKPLQEQNLKADGTTRC